MIRIGCLHAHHSNIEYIEGELTPYNVKMVHFVDPGLMYHMDSGPNVHIAEKVEQQLNWIESCQVDAILITCTNYIALLDETDYETATPIIKIDEPFFEQICKNSEPQTLLFSNPATVSGTMNRLFQYADKWSRTVKVEARLIENSFQFIMNGEKDAYNHAIVSYLEKYSDSEHISVAQLSMVNGARKSGKDVFHPLDALIKHVVQHFELDKQA